MARAVPARDDGVGLADEVLFSIDLVALLVRDARARLRGDGSIGSVPEGERAKLGVELDALRERYRGTVAAPQPARRARRQPALAGQTSAPPTRRVSADPTLGRPAPRRPTASSGPIARRAPPSAPTPRPPRADKRRVVGFSCDSNAQHTVFPHAVGVASQTRPDSPDAMSDRSPASRRLGRGRRSTASGVSRGPWCSSPTP